MGLISDKQKKAIIKSYYYRLKALNIDGNELDLIKKLLPLSSDDLNNSFSKMMNGSQTEIINLLKKLGIPVNHKNEPNNNFKENINDISESHSELLNDIIIVLENNEEIAKIIEDGLINNLTNEQIGQSINNVISSKYPKFKSIPNLNIIIIDLIDKRKNDRGKGTQGNSLGGRQYVLSNNKNPFHSSEAEYEVA